jgi:Flp pilus assembly protein TadD
MQAASAYFSRAAAIAPDEPHVRVTHGVMLRRQGRLDEASALYARALALGPRGAASAYGALGMARYLQGRHAEATASLHAAQALEPIEPSDRTEQQGPSSRKWWEKAAPEVQ